MRALRNPSAAFETVMAIARGRFYKTWLPIRGIRFTAGRNFKVFGKLVVRGPGRVIFGNDVVVSMEVTPFTYAADAVLRVGNHVFLNGTRFGCVQRVEIGDDCILAQCRVMDTNFHSTRADRWNPEAPVRVKPVILERNVWVATDAGLLPGTVIGENSVVGFGAVCSGSYPANTLIAGNPATVQRDIEPAPAS